MDDTNWFNDLTTDEAKEERATLAQRLIAWLGVVCLIVLVGLATNVHAEPLITRHGKDYVRLMDGPCVAPKIVDLFVQGGAMKHLPSFKAAAADIEGEHIAGCWRSSSAPEGFYIIFFEDREPLVFPQEMFVLEAV
jgi:hypothetical protein